jgi:hypothetical protein
MGSADQRPVAEHGDRPDAARHLCVVAARGFCCAIPGRGHVGQRATHRDRRVPPAVHPLAVRGAAHLRRHPVEGEVEGGELVLGAGLGADHRALGEAGELDTYGAVGLSRVALLLDLHLDADDAMVVLLQSGELLPDVFAELVRQLAVPTVEHDVHQRPPLFDDFLWVLVGGARPADLVFDPTTAC